jgi:hypothetical protein
VQISMSTVGDSDVSTVWVGFNVGYVGGPLRIFETMVFGGAMDGALVRYPTEADAIAGHAVMEARVRESQATAKAPDGCVFRLAPRGTPCLCGLLDFPHYARWIAVGRGLEAETVCDRNHVAVLCEVLGEDQP